MLSIYDPIYPIRPGTRTWRTIAVIRRRTALLLAPKRAAEALPAPARASAPPEAASRAPAPVPAAPSGKQKPRRRRKLGSRSSSLAIRRKIYYSFLAHGPCTIAHGLAQVGLNKEGSRYHIRAMQAAGLLSTVGHQTTVAAPWDDELFKGDEKC